MALIAICALIVTAVAGLALAFGAALAYWLPLSLFQAALLFIAATGITLLAALTLTVIHYTAEDDFLCDDCRRQTGDKVKVWEHVHRNDPCPCGSGKKFKNCCGIYS